MNHHFIIKKCSIKDINSLMALQDGVFEDLGTSSDLLRRNTQDMFERCLQPPHTTIGIFDHHELVGVGILFDGVGTDDDMSHSIQTISCSKGSSINAKLIMIRHSYYGLGIQSLLLGLFDRIAKRQGFAYICCTVAPQNHHSKVNIIKAGYRYDHTQKKYEGLEREVYIKTL